MEAQRRLPWTLIAIWAVAGALAVFSSSLIFHAAHWNGEYLPVAIDSFYHARRILDTVHDFSAFYEFDPRIHVPEGSLLTWPWGYDYAMAIIVRIGLALGLGDNPIAILIWIPVIAAPISVALMIAIARQLGLSTALTAIAALCLAIATTTQMLHAVGFIDHHYAEFIFILSALAAGLAWLRKPESTRRAVAVGVVLGLAPAIQNGLFIIQLPLLATLFVHWLQGQSVPRRTGAIFAIALLVTTMAILLPSLPFRMGRFEFYTLSWFHLYIAACSAVTVALLSRLTATRGGVIAVLGTSAVLLIPILREMVLASGFIAGTPEHLQLISEMKSPLNMMRSFGAPWVASYYSNLIWFAPLSALVCVFNIYQERNSPRLLFWITSSMGLALLASQARMQYFGNFALYLPWLVLLQEFCDKRPQHIKNATLLASLAMLVSFYPSLRHRLDAMPTANDVGFRETRPILASLSKVCAEDPGVVLADIDVAHYVRYYTECSVIANNFLLTPQHYRKVDEVTALYELPAREFAAKAPQVKYVLVRASSIALGDDGGVAYDFLQPNPQLFIELLLQPQATVPAEFTLVDEVRLAELNNAIYAKLYRVGHDTAVAPAAPKLSANAVGK